MAGRPLPGLKGPQAGTCHPSWTVSHPSPASDLPEGKLRVFGRKDKLPGQGRALTFQSLFCECPAPRCLKTAFPWGQGRRKRPAWEVGVGSPVFPGSITPTGRETAIRATFQVESFPGPLPPPLCPYFPPPPRPDHLCHRASAECGSALS